MAGARRLASLTIPLVVAGCALPPVETPEAARERRLAECRSAGFTADSPELRLCVLLEQTNERLEQLDRRLRRIEQDVQFFPGPHPHARGRWW